MNNDITEQIEEQIEQAADTNNAVASISDLPLLTPELLESDRQKKVDTVEINISDRSAKIVETSDAPKLTKAILTESAKPIKTVAMPFNSLEWQVHVRHGRTLRLDIECERLLDGYPLPSEKEAPEKRAEVLATREREARNMILSRMIVNPQWSFQGEGEGQAIEEQSDVLINALWQAHLSVNSPIDDEIYQVSVVRGAPIHANLLIGKTFETYPLGSVPLIKDMTDDDLEVMLARNEAQRNIWVTSMIASPKLSLNGKGASGAFGIENLAEAYLATLYNAYSVVNVPEATLSEVRRFRRKPRNRRRKNNSK